MSNPNAIEAGDFVELQTGANAVCIGETPEGHIKVVILHDREAHYSAWVPDAVKLVRKAPTTFADLH